MWLIAIADCRNPGKSTSFSLESQGLTNSLRWDPKPKRRNLEAVPLRVPLPRRRQPARGLDCSDCSRFAVLGDRFVSFPPASLHSAALLKSAKEAESPARERVLGQNQLQLS